MSFLLDTNVVSEWTKPQTDPGVVRWLAGIDEDRVCLSVVSLAEFRFGVNRLAEGARRTRLDRWLIDELPQRFEGRLLPVDRTVADHWGRLEARTRTRGRAMGAIDAFIAATALAHGLVVVTRTVADFTSSGVEVISPWSD